ncbi:MAG: TadE/TadG family type IV pilus assembly protein [Tepidisphaeraceae bacterium]
MQLKTRRFRRGSAVMEAALVLPVLITLTMGAMEFGYFFYVKHTLQGAAREGARAAITPSATSSDVTTAVTNSMRAAGFTDTSKYTVSTLSADGSTTVNPATVTAGTGIQVRVSATWGNVGISALGPISPLKTNKSVVGQTVMRKEG